MTAHLIQRSAPLLAALVLAGCVNYSGIETHATLVKPDNLGLNQTATQTTQWPTAKPWEIVHDPVLNGLIEQALAQNPNIRIAQARLAQVAAMASQADANRYPALGIGASVTPEHFTENGLYPPPYAGSIYSTNQLMVNAKYEFDFWGKNRDYLAAALSQQRAAQAEVESARLLIETSVTKSYYTLASDLEQKAIMEKMLAQREELTNLASRSKSAGLETSQGLESVRQAIPALKAIISYYDEQIELARNALAALIGQGPQSTREVMAKFPDSVDFHAPESVPADLIGRRSDIAAARARVEAANKMINVSKAEFYPDVNIAAFAGFSSLGFAHWLDGTSRDYGVGPAISLPIFDAGRLRADLRGKSAEYDQAVESYNQTLIEAVHDVANQLTSLRAIDVQQHEQHELLTSAESVYEINAKRAQAGLVDRATVLNAETNLLSQQSLALLLRARSVDLHVNLIRALGGGFDEQTTLQSTASSN